MSKYLLKTMKTIKKNGPFKKITMPKKDSNTHDLSTTHIFKSLIKMLESIDPVERYRLQFNEMVKRQEKIGIFINNKTWFESYLDTYFTYDFDNERYYKFFNNSYTNKHCINKYLCTNTKLDYHLYKFFYKFSTRKSNYFVKDIDKNLFNFLNQISILKKKNFFERKDIFFFNSISKKKYLLDIIDNKCLYLLAFKLSNVLENKYKYKVNNLFLSESINYKESYFLWILNSFKIDNIVLSTSSFINNLKNYYYNNNLKINNYQFLFSQKVFLLLKKSVWMEFMPRSNLKFINNSIHYYKLKNCFFEKNINTHNTFFTSNQFNLLKILVSNLWSIGLVNDSKFSYSIYLLNFSKNSYSTICDMDVKQDKLFKWKLFCSFFYITNSYINFSNSGLILKSKNSNINLKEFVFDFMLFSNEKYITSKKVDYRFINNVKNFSLSKKILQILMVLKKNSVFLKYVNSYYIKILDKLILDTLFIEKFNHPSTFIFFKNISFLKHFKVKSKKYNLFLDKIKSTTIPNNIFKSHSLAYIDSIINNIIHLFETHPNIKSNYFMVRRRWKKNRTFKVKRSKLIPILILKKKRKYYFLKFFKILKLNKKPVSDKLISEKVNLIKKSINRSSKQSLYLNQSKEYSYIYLTYLNKNKLLKLFRNFLIKNGLKKKADNIFIKILRFIKLNYRVCPVRTLRFLLLRHYKLSFIKEKKLKKKIIHIPKRLSVRKQLFYMVFFFFKEVYSFNSGYKEFFSYKRIKNNENRITFLIKNYIQNSMDLGVYPKLIIEKNKSIEKQVYSLKHFLKKKKPLINFKKHKSYSLYKGHHNIRF